MSTGEVNPNNRRKVRSRQMVGETPKAPGFRGSSQATSAMGSLYGRSNVYVAQPAESVNMWGNLSRTLGNVMLKLERNKTEEDAEAKRLRLKQEALEEETQRLQGMRMANEINRTLIQGVIEGGITNPEEADAYAFEQLEQVAPVMSTPFYNAAYSKVVDGLDFVGGEFNKKLEADTLTNARNILARSMTQVGLNIQNTSREEYQTAVRQATDVGVKSGLSLQQTQQVIFNSQLSIIRALGMGEKTTDAYMLMSDMVESGLAASIPPNEGGQSGTEATFRAFYDVIDEQNQREKQMTQRDHQNRSYTRDANYGTFLVNAAAATTAPQVQEMRDQLTNLSPDDVMEQYGAQGANLYKLLDNQEDYVITGRTPTGNAEAMAEIEERIRNADYSLIDDPAALNNYADRLTLMQLNAYRSKLADIRGKQDPDENILVNSALSRLQGFFNPPEGSGGTPPPYVGLSLIASSLSGEGKATAAMTQAGYAVRDILIEAVRKVNPTAFQDNPIGLREARQRAIQEAEDAIKSGNDRSFVDVANAERAAMGQEELTLAQQRYDIDRDIRNNPENLNKVINTIMPPNSSPSKVLRDIKRFADPKLQDYLKLHYTSTQVVDRLVRAEQLEMTASEMDAYEASVWEDSSQLSLNERELRAQERMARRMGNSPDMSQRAEELRGEVRNMRQEAVTLYEGMPKFEQYAPYVVDDPTAAAYLLVNSLPPKEESK